MASPVKKAAKVEISYLQKRLQEELSRSAGFVDKLGSVKKFLNELIRADQVQDGDQMVDGKYAKAARIMLEEIDQ